MKNSLFLCFMLLLLAACKPTTKTTETTSENTEYTDLSDKKNAAAYVDKNISMEGQLSEMVMQHMMAMEMDQNMQPLEYFYFDPKEGSALGQIMVYFSKSVLESEDSLKGKKFRIYGVLRVSSGAGKGGGTHTEYRVVLKKIEML